MTRAPRERLPLLNRLLRFQRQLFHPHESNLSVRTPVAMWTSAGSPRCVINMRKIDTNPYGTLVQVCHVTYERAVLRSKPSRGN
jgi:hypothetical protein